MDSVEKGCAQAVDLKHFSTFKVASELETREGVKTIKVAPYEPYEIVVKSERIQCDGPAIIYVVVD